jgi:mannan endo-1,4-beta-mannosidase
MQRVRGSFGGESVSVNQQDLDTPQVCLDVPAASRRRLAVGLVAAAAAALMAGGSSAKSKRKRKRKNKQRDASIGKAAHVALGAFVPQALDDSVPYNEFIGAIGRAPDFLVWYEDWANGNFNSGHRTYLNTIDERNLTPVIDWEPFDSDGPTIDQPAYKLSTISRGNHDSYIDSWAEGLAAYGKPVFIKFAHEMNGSWFPWGVGVNGNVAGDIVDAWRHIHGRFARAGADNVRWVWVPNKVYDTIPASFHQVYPGDDYVDWIGVNGYNWGASVYWESCPCQSRWETFAEVFDRSYRDLVALADKPIMIGETASSEKGDDKASWITNALVQELPNRYPKVRALTWFHTKATGLDTNQNGEVVPTATVDWRITSSEEARRAFRDAVANEYYKHSLRSL